MKVGQHKIGKERIKPMPDAARAIKRATIKGPLAKGTKGLEGLTKLGGYKKL